MLLVIALAESFLSPTVHPNSAVRLWQAKAVLSTDLFKAKKRAVLASVGTPMSTRGLRFI